MRTLKSKSSPPWRTQKPFSIILHCNICDWCRYDEDFALSEHFEVSARAHWPDMQVQQICAIVWNDKTCSMPYQLACTTVNLATVHPVHIPPAADMSTDHTVCIFGHTHPALPPRLSLAIKTCLCTSLTTKMQSQLP